jgi:Bacterial aa3 type cytochrome c oxidase subunit IV
MAGKASQYHRGDMDIHEQVSTFHLVMNITKWGSLVLAAAILTLVIWFCTSAGFLSGAISGLVVLGLGTILLRSPAGGEH